MNKYFTIIFTLFFSTYTFAQETSIQFPRIDFHMKMNQKLQPSISYNVVADIVVGDKSGLIFSIGVDAEDVNLQSDVNALVKLDTLKLSVVPSTVLSIHTFFGRYKYLGEDKVIPRGFQFNYTPGTDYYGYKKLEGAGLAMTFPIQDGRYEPEFILFSSTENGIDYLNLDFITTFRFELWYLELYGGMAIPTIGSIDSSIKAHGGFSIYTSLELVNIYFALYIPSQFGTEFTFDDIYMRLSQYLLVNGFEQTFSVYTLGAESGNLNDPIIGLEGIPDINVFLSLGGRINNIGFGVDYGFIYGLYQSEALVLNLQNISHRAGVYTDIMFLGLVYKFGMYYTLPNSAAYIKDINSPGEVGFYVSVFGRS